MLRTTIVTTKNELEQIHHLNRMNIKQNLDDREKEEQGFVSWLYPVELLEQMHQLAPGIIVKDDDRVIAYALTTLKESKSFHKDLAAMFSQLENVMYNGRTLSSHNFYCMGQICIAKDYRGRGLVKELYHKHREIYKDQFDFILTEISSKNERSIKAHQRVGFKTIYKYRDEADEWEVVVWNWE